MHVQCNMKKILLGVIVCISLNACSKEQFDVKVSSSEVLFDVKIKESTKVSSGTFEPGDAFSLFATEYDGEDSTPLSDDGNFFNNVKITYNGASWNSSEKLLWGMESCDFYAIYPYQGSVASVNKYPFTVSADQSEEGYECSDILFTKSSKVNNAKKTVELEFEHIL